MPHYCTESDNGSPDTSRITETPVIGVVVVIYNKKCTESVSFAEVSGNGTVLAVLIDNSTDLQIQSFNRAACSNIGCEYISMDGNKGLAKAYNAAVGQIGSRIDYLMLLDDDTVVPEDVIPVLRKAIAQNTSADVLVPFVLDQSTLLSPCRRWSSLFFRLKKRPESFDGKMSAINSGLVIRIDQQNREKPLFDDKMFLDCIDHDFILQRIRQGGSFMLYSAEFRQNFFDRTSREQAVSDLAFEEHGRVSEEHGRTQADQIKSRNAAMIRFGIFAKDYLYFCRDCSLSMLIARMYLIYRMTRLNGRYRTTDFGSVLKNANKRTEQINE